MAGKGGGTDLGNLFDLLNEAKKGVEAERKQTIDTETEQRDRAAREEREREEARRREEAQKTLIEENRRRNEALAKRDKVEGERKALATSPHMRPVDDGPKPAAPQVVAPPPRKASALLLAALVVAGVGLGVGGAFAVQPEKRGAFPDVDVAARAVVAQTSKAAAVERNIQGELAQARAKIAELEKQFGGLGVEGKQLRDELATTRQELATARADLQALRDAGARPAGRPTGRTNGGGGNNGLPTLQGNVFK